MSEEISFKNATIYFTYPFLPVPEKGPLNKESFTDFISCNIEGTECRGGFGKPESRIGLSVYIALDLEMAYLCLPTINAHLNNIELTIDTTVRVFPSSSACTFAVKTKRDDSKEVTLQVSDIHEILHLVSQKHNIPTGNVLTGLQIEGMPEAKSEAFLDTFNIDPKETTLFEMYVRIADKLEQNYNAIIYERYQDDEEEISKHKIGLLGRAHISEKTASLALEYQCPWVVSVLEITGEAHTAFCTDFADSENPLTAKHHAIREYEKDIAPILYRSVTGKNFHVDPAYSDFKIDGDPVLLYNMNVDSSLFVQTSRRSILCLCGDQSEDPAAYFIPSLLDLCEMIHSRSNALVIFNKVLDESLRNFSDPNVSSSSRLKRIITVINRFISCLEDPSSYVISGDALREIHENLVDTSRISSLRSTLLKKIDMLEKLYKYRRELVWAEEA